MTPATFLESLPAELAPRLSDPADPVVALYLRVQAPAPRGPALAALLAVKRDDPLTRWLAAYAILACDDVVGATLCGRAMFAAFGASLVDPFVHLARQGEDRVKVSAALGAAISDSTVAGPDRSSAAASAFRERLAPLQREFAPPSLKDSQDVIRDLWSATYADPGNLEPRYVLADLYTAAGDPRGPFMSESLAALGSGFRPKGESSLLKVYEQKWLADFRGRVLGHPRWEGGVVAGCHVRAVHPPDLPAWRTVHTLLCDDADANAADVTPARFPSLRVFGMVTPLRLLLLVASGMLQQLERVYVGVENGGRGDARFGDDGWRGVPVPLRSRVTVVPYRGWHRRGSSGLRQPVWRGSPNPPELDYLPAIAQLPAR